jgi:hypothetical protein
MPVGGDIIEVTCNHPTLGAFVYFPKSAEDSTYDLGGYRATDDSNMIDGGGNMIDQLNRARWSFEVPLSMDMITEETMESLVSMAGSTELGEWTFTNINGTVYQGTGKPVGDLQGNGNASTIPLKVSGGGRLRKIA